MAVNVNHARRKTTYRATRQYLFDTSYVHKVNQDNIPTAP